jgi:hypothetical protein
MRKGITWHQAHQVITSKYIHPTKTNKGILYMISRYKPSTVNQQRKAMGLRLVEKCACTVAPHDCHPQSHSHSFQEKENDTCTFKRRRLLIVRIQKHNILRTHYILTNIPTTCNYHSVSLILGSFANFTFNMKLSAKRIYVLDEKLRPNNGVFSIPCAVKNDISKDKATVKEIYSTIITDTFYLHQIRIKISSLDQLYPESR